jgi:hypothetical protein
MQYEVDIGGRRLQVVVTRSGDGFAVSVDGRLHHVDAARIDAHVLSLVVDSVRSNEVSIAADPIGGLLNVHVGATPVAVALNGRRRWGRREEGAGRGSGRNASSLPCLAKSSVSSSRPATSSPQDSRSWWSKQ